MDVLDDDVVPDDEPEEALGVLPEVDGAGFVPAAVVPLPFVLLDPAAVVAVEDDRESVR